MEIDLNLIRSLLTLLLFISFCGLMIFIIFRGGKAYDEAANLPFIEDEQ